MKKCKKCKGVGKIRLTNDFYLEGFHWVLCPKCWGKGMKQ